MRTTVKMGLASWNEPDDDYSFEQLSNNWQLLDFHDHSPGRGVPISAGGLATGAVTANALSSGIVGSQHLTTLLAADLGLGATGRGALVISTAQTTTSSSFTTLATADQITGLVLNANGFIRVNFQAFWKISSGSGFAAITLNGTPVVQAVANGVPSIDEVVTAATHYSPLFTTGAGLNTTSSFTSDSTEVTTGELMAGGEARIYASAGTYTVGIGYATDGGGGTLSARNRRLWAQVENF